MNSKLACSPLICAINRSYSAKTIINTGPGRSKPPVRFAALQQSTLQPKLQVLASPNLISPLPPPPSNPVIGEMMSGGMAGWGGGRALYFVVPVYEPWPRRRGLAWKWCDNQGVYTIVYTIYSGKPYNLLAGQGSYRPREARQQDSHAGVLAHG